jgi:hypothetical protein
MELIRDKNMEGEAAWYFPGDYLGTWFSARGQVRIDLFDEGGDVVAHISFPTGLDGSTVEDRYVTPLSDYAAKQGFSDRLKLVFAEKSLNATS